MYREEFGEEEAYVDYGGMDEDYGEGFLPGPEVIEPGTTFVVRMKNVPFRMEEGQAKKELLANGIEFDKVTLKKDGQGRVQEITVELSKEDSTKKLFNLRGKDFLGRRLRIDPIEYVQPKTASTKILAPAPPKKEAAPTQSKSTTEEKKAVNPPASSEEHKTSTSVKKPKKVADKKESGVKESITLPANASGWGDITANDVKPAEQIAKYVPPAKKPASSKSAVKKSKK